jgi:hypothetical protein
MLIELSKQAKKEENDEKPTLWKTIANKSPSIITNNNNNKIQRYYTANKYTVLEETHNKKKEREREKGNTKTCKNYTLEQLNKIENGQDPNMDEHLQTVVLTGIRSNRYGKIRALIQQKVKFPPHKIERMNTIGRNAIFIHDNSNQKYSHSQ